MNVETNLDRAVAQVELILDTYVTEEDTRQILITKILPVLGDLLRSELREVREQVEHVLLTTNGGLKMPKAYVIGNFKVVDSEKYMAYADKAKAAIEAEGGTFLVRGGRMEIVEGESNERVVIAEFPDWASAQRASTAVEDLVEDERGDSGEGHMIIVEGV